MRFPCKPYSPAPKPPFPTSHVGEAGKKPKGLAAWVLVVLDVLAKIPAIVSLVVVILGLAL